MAGQYGLELARQSFMLELPPQKWHQLRWEIMTPVIEVPVIWGLTTNLQKFKQRVNSHLSDIRRKQRVDEWNGSLTKVTCSSASKIIPMKKSPQRGTVVPWWNEGCNTAAGAWNRACRKLGKHPTKSYAIGYKRLRTKAGRVIKEAGDTSVENYEQIVLLKKKNLDFSSQSEWSIAADDNPHSRSSLQCFLGSEQERKSKYTS